MQVILTQLASANAEVLANWQLSGSSRPWGIVTGRGRSWCVMHPAGAATKANAAQHSPASVSWQPCSAWFLHREKGKLTLYWFVLGQKQNSVSRCYLWEKQECRPCREGGSQGAELMQRVQERRAAPSPTTHHAWCVPMLGLPTWLTEGDKHF